MRVVIIGNGVAGFTAALGIRKRRPDAHITMISGESREPISRPALMYLYMGHMRHKDIQPYPSDLWQRERISLAHGWVTHIDVNARAVQMKDGTHLSYDRLLLATGSRTNQFGWPGQDLEHCHGMVSLQDLAALEAVSPRLKRGVIVGGGLIGVELAEMLRSRGIETTVLVREGGFWGNVLPTEEANMVDEVVRNNGVDLRLCTELAEIHDDGQGRVGAATTSTGDRIACEFVGLTAGVRPNLSAVAGSTIPTHRGILVNEFMETSISGVFAAGDCAEIQPDGAETYLQQVWYTGRAQGEVAAANICGDPQPYQPGIWFNSAKFFDLEFQVYGIVPPTPADDVHQLFWKADDASACIRLVQRHGALVGIQSMGTRLRHRVCEQWIETQATVTEVIEKLSQAAFDPEFARNHCAAARTHFRRQAAP